MVNFFAVFCSLFIMLEISNWMQHTKQSIKLSCEVMVFLLCETVIWLRIIVVFKVFSSETHSSNDADATENISNSLLGTVIRLWSYYVFLFGPVVNLLTHLLLIHHIIRKARIIFFTSTYAYNVSFYWTLFVDGRKSTKVHRGGQDIVWYHRMDFYFWLIATFDLIGIIHWCRREEQIDGCYSNGTTVPFAVK